MAVANCNANKYRHCFVVDYLRQRWYDTVIVSGPALDCARATFGADRLVYGTDEPNVPNGSKAARAALRTRPWPEADLRAALSSNAHGLLEGPQSGRLKWTVP